MFQIEYFVCRILRSFEMNYTHMQNIGYETIFFVQDIINQAGNFITEIWNSIINLSKIKLVVTLINFSNVEITTRSH